MGYTAPNWVNGNPPAINATRLNDLCSTVQTLDETMPTKQDKLTFDNVPTSGSSNPVKSNGIKTALDAKQNNLTFDNTPTAGSSNPVKSSGIYTALQGKQSSLTFDSTPIQGSTNPVTSGGVYGHRVVAGQKEGETLGEYATAEGYNTTASGSSSHAEGANTTASGASSHAEGIRTSAEGQASHAEGYGTIAAGPYQHVFGKYNAQNIYDVEIVGWGTSATNRKDIRSLASNGNEWIAGTLTQSSDARLKDVAGEIPDVSGIRAVRFKWNDTNGEHDDKDHIGYIAQEVEKVAPFMVKEDSNGYKALDYIAFLCAKMELLERRVKELEEKKE